MEETRTDVIQGTHNMMAGNSRRAKFYSLTRSGRKQFAIETANSVAMILAAFFGSYLPARRASRVDRAEALRAE